MHTADPAGWARPPTIPVSALTFETPLATPLGPRAYALPAIGECMGETCPAGSLMIADPDVWPKVGDWVAVYFRTGWAMAVVPRTGKMFIFKHDDLAHDAELRDDIKAMKARVFLPGGFGLMKQLVKPLPPREAWADDYRGDLVVEQLNPLMELRARLSNVWAIDTITATVPPGNLRVADGPVAPMLSPIAAAAL